MIVIWFAIITSEFVSLTVATGGGLLRRCQWTFGSCARWQAFWIAERLLEGLYSVGLVKNWHFSSIRALLLPAEEHFLPYSYIISISLCTFFICDRRWTQVVCFVELPQAGYKLCTYCFKCWNYLLSVGTCNRKDLMCWRKTRVTCHERSHGFLPLEYSNSHKLNPALVHVYWTQQDQRCNCLMWVRDVKIHAVAVPAFFLYSRIRALFILRSCCYHRHVRISPCPWEQQLLLQHHMELLTGACRLSPHWAEWMVHFTFSHSVLFKEPFWS
jgi:hypothetical protein